ncbi:MAG: SGNH/GDSL hydrolase family protein [Planctomycetes bacterium]|nr:SGNH/GDSL hydrolase family protein [Planctomycetota bacterium]MCH9724738.1 SGNH/GDSL hydrolase family protein [Planctomycetota bacterium]MCH9778816.1 SGNH/GDSL hydrolase family protein [Planctomycetota bacterium]MCH9790404.1 SGNH/GDSL hydrolase family protein [Planctomycetota bacterium]
MSPSFIKLLILSIFISGSYEFAKAAPPVYHPVKAKLVQPRQGIGNTLLKLKQNQDVRVAYLGGSITAAPGWRVKTTKWLQEVFPESKIHEIHAAIGGTGSDLGAFRLEHDVLQHRPDLVFIEFAVNDGGRQPESIWESMEGILRQIWKANPQTDICFVYTFRVNYENDLRKGECPRAASAMELLAEHYGIPSINVALKIVELESLGKLIFKSDTPLSDEVIRFSKDGVHPLDRGHEIYTDVIGDAIEQMQLTSEPVNHASQLKRPFVTGHWSDARMVPLTSTMLAGNWKTLSENDPLKKRFGGRLGQIWEADKPGSRLTFQFRGSQSALYDLLGPDGGQLLITIDGKQQPKLRPRFDSYCTYHRIATLKLGQNLDPQAIHTVTIEIHPEQPDRSSVAFRLKDPAQELKTPKYQGTKIRVGKIMLRGELVP